jgi:hypothetical protein
MRRGNGQNPRRTGKILYAGNMYSLIKIMNQLLASISIRLRCKLRSAGYLAKTGCHAPNHVTALISSSNSIKL